MHQGEAGLRIPTGLVSREECLLRALDVSDLQPDAAKFGQGPPELPSQVRAQFFAGQEDCTLVRASTTENQDLFWALRGAGHNFGGVSSFEYQLHPVSTVLGGMVVHPFTRALDVLRFYREFIAEQPDELTTAVALLTGPDGNLVVAMVVCCAGTIAEGEHTLAPLRTFGSPVADTIGPIPYLQQQTALDAAYPFGRLNYWKCALTDELGDEVLEAIVDAVELMPSPLSAIPIADFHGAYRRVGKADTAYYHRDLRYDIVIGANWTDPADSERNVGWARDLYHAIEPHLPRGVYVNDLDADEGDERVRQAYGENYQRLAALKAKYDPTNFFRVNQNIGPAGQGASLGR